MAVTVNRLLFSRLSLWVVLTLAGGYFIYNIKHYIKFGIDLVGGTYITLEVQLQKARDLELVEKMKDAEMMLKNNNKPLPEDTKICDGTVILTFASVQDAVAANEFLMARDVATLFEQTENKVRIKFSPAQIKEMDRNAIESNILALNNRMDQVVAGVGETLIVPKGDNRIVLELPDVHNIQQAKAMIGKAALLEIKVVEDVASSEQELLAKYDGNIPEGTIIVPGTRGAKEAYLVPQYTDITGRLLKTAKQGFGGPVGADPVVEFEFKPLGAERFYELTSNSVGRNVAIIIDGEVISAPRVNEAISGRGSISGSFTVQSAQQLALLLRSGAFVAPVSFEEERHIGPSLGQESIRQGLLSCAVGMALLFLFSVVVYKMAGLLAFIILMYNILLTLVLLWALGATLTLPGIAGILLTIGMAIDASILIYERMREELAEGVPLRKAIDSGFGGAFAVIMDSNLTNLLVAIVLYYFGSGAIQGFAVTMIVGIIATLITGLWLLRSFFTFATDVLGINKISI